MNRFVLGAAAGLALAAFAAPANAADLGGDCCADLEERVAELEATTARKGNRKVSLKIYGHVSSALMFWDDSVEDDVYVVDNGPSASRFGFKGKAKINSDWSAGYKIEIQVGDPSEPKKTSQSTDEGGSFKVRKSEMYLKSKRLGKISWGLGSSAVDDLTHYGSLLGYVDQPDWNWYSGFTVVGTSNKISAYTVGFDGPRIDRVRYDTPKIAGFTASASWGEDDYWDVAIRYAGKVGDFKIKAAVGYADDEEGEEEVTRASALVWHKPTGIFVQGALADYEYDNGDPDAFGYHVAGGIKRKFNSLGATTIWGSYGNVEDALVSGSEADRWTVGVAQKIDAAALELFAMYQNAEFDDADAQTDEEDFDAVIIGGRIKF